MLETGKRTGMGMSAAAGLAEVFGVTVDELISGELSTLEKAARRRRALDMLEDARDLVMMEPLAVGSELMVPDRGTVPVTRSTWDSRGEESTMQTPIPPAWLAGRAPQTCYVVTIAGGGIPDRGLVAGTRVLFSSEGELIDGGIVLVCLYGRVRVGVYRARGERVECAGDGDERDEAWPEDGYDIMSYYLAHWSVGQGS